MQFGIGDSKSTKLSRWLSAAAFVLLVAATGLSFSADSGATGEEQTAELKEMIRELREQLRDLVDDRDARIEALEKRLAELESRLRDERAAREDDDLAAILAEAEAETSEERQKEEDADKERDSFEGRQRSLQKMNPEISFVGDFSADWADSDDLRNQFTLRGVELAFEAPLDPYTRFKAYLGAHQHPTEIEIPGEEDEHGEIFTEVEEAYIEWVALPLNTQVTVGKFRQQFGTLNRWHRHALPTVESPFALRDMFGMEGLNGIGVAARWLFPETGKTTTSLEVQITNADNEIVFAGGDFQDPAFLLRPSAFVDLGPATYFEIGLTGMTGPNDEETDRTDLGGVDVNFTWEPVHRAKYRNVELRGEYIQSRFEETDEATGVQDTIRADSWYLYATGRVSRRWSVGLRYDDAELPSPRWPLIDPVDFREGLWEKAWTPFVTFWQSEYVRLRFQYQHATRNFVGEQGPMDDDRAWFQITWSAGPHKHEEY